MRQGGQVDLIFDGDSNAGSVNAQRAVLPTVMSAFVFFVTIVEIGIEVVLVGITLLVQLMVANELQQSGAHRAVAQHKWPAFADWRGHITKRNECATNKTQC
jgi:hypothetical protein